jgi:hypothetical protein
MRTPAVRLVSAPPLEPPFDDQRDPQAYPLPPESGAQLTLQWRAPAAPTGDGSRCGAARVTLPPGAAAGASQEAWHAALRFLDRCQEILNGYRPAAHIRPLSTPMEAQAIVEQVAAVARRTSLLSRAGQLPQSSQPPQSSQLPRAGQPGGRFAGQLSGRLAGRPVRVVRRRVHVCEPRPGAAEAMAVLSQASRTWAVAFRLERRGTAWLCTAFTDVNQSAG